MLSPNFQHALRNQKARSPSLRTAQTARSVRELFSTRLAPPSQQGTPRPINKNARQIQSTISPPLCRNFPSAHMFKIRFLVCISFLMLSIGTPATACLLGHCSSSTPGAGRVGEHVRDVVRQKRQVQQPVTRHRTGTLRTRSQGGAHGTDAAGAPESCFLTVRCGARRGRVFVQMFRF